jgi:hypothetical protein
MSLQLSNYTVEHMPAHLKPSPELSKSVQGALGVEVVVPKLIVSGNSIVVQTLMPNSRSTEPWNALLLGLMVHNGRREQLGIIIGRIIVRQKKHGNLVIRHRKMQWSSKCTSKANGRTPCVRHTGSPNLACLGRLYRWEIPLKLAEAAGVPTEVGDASEKLTKDEDASRTRW